MANSVRVYSEKELDFWTALLDECAVRYKVERNSEYGSGLGSLIEYDLPEDIRR